MMLSVRGVAALGAALFGGTILLVGVVNLANPDYGAALLDVAASLYPGYGGAESGAVGVLIGTAYGVLDGAVGGAILAWVYNRVAAPSARAA